MNLWNININQKNVKYRNFSYYLIIKAKKAEKMYKELYTIKNKFGLNLYLIVYNKVKKINKRPFQIKSHLPIFIENNENEIINFIKSQEYINCGINFTNETPNLISSFQNLMKNKDIKFLILKLKMIK